MKPIFSLLIAAVVTLSPFLCRAEVKDRIVAVVNDEIVTLREVEKFVVVEKKSPYTSMNEYTMNLQLRDKLDSFVESLLLGQQAKKMKIEVTDKEVQDMVEAIKKQNLVSDVELKRQLEDARIDYKDFLSGLKNNLIRNKVLARTVMQETDLNDSSLKAYYDEHLSDYVGEEYRLQQIFVSGQRKDAAMRAQEALKRLNEGRPFGDVAREFSDDTSRAVEGDMGYIKKEDLIPEFRDALKLLIPGTYSNIVRTGFGYHILKLAQVKKGEAAPFESVKDSVRGALSQIESAKRYKSYINKLRDSAYIEVKI